jgi:signal transduction histidine kinase
LAAAPEASAAQIDAAMADANALDGIATRLGELVRNEAHMEHQQLSDRLRRQVLILSIIFLVMINLAIIALMRAAAMILRPVDQLVKVAHELGLEHFEARVQIDDDTEFGQLARAYNRMAQQLQANEQRKMEFLGQVALTMSHELNNVINIIELQLTLLSRRAGESEPLQAPLKQIRQSLKRMTGVVDDLRHTRRIVLTEYMDGVKMLDLRQSTQESNLAEELAPAGRNPENGL